MYLIYVDESGKPNLQDSEDYVLGSLIINENRWVTIDNQVRTLKNHFFPTVDDSKIELHASEIVNHEKLFQNLTNAQIFDLLEACYNLISNIDCCLIASVIRKDNIYQYIRNRPDINDWIERWGHRVLFERICLYLDKVNKENVSKAIPIDYGILLIDSVNIRYDQLLRKKILELFKKGTYYIQNKYLIEDPLFISSQYRNLTQLVDLVSFIVRRRYRNNSSDSFFNQKYLKYFSLIENKFDTDENGTIEGCGVKFFPRY